MNNSNVVSSFGISLELVSDELIIKGNGEDLKELANYIQQVTQSRLESNHLHLDDLTLISSTSKIKQLVIEKEDKKNTQN